MTTCECKNKCECTLFAVIASLVIGIVAVFLNFSSTLVITQTLLWAFFGASIVFLLIGLLASFGICKSDNRECLCTAVNEFLLGILATVLFSVILLTVDIAAAGLLASILVGILFGVFTLTLTSAACIIKYNLKCKD